MKQKTEKELGITVKKDDNFSEWYTQVMLKAELADYSAVSGCMVLRPYSYSIWEKVKAELDKRFKKEGVENAYFPLFIPEKLLLKEQEHVKGFSPEVAWVTHAGNSKLDERLAIRPTSEAIMYDSYAKWIRSWRDLPLRLNQWNNVVRWEFKNPVPFLRTREFLWQEGHTAFANQKEADAEGPVILGIYNYVVNDLMALASFTGRKSDKEKFAGAQYTDSIELLLPNGKAIQGPDFHSDGQNFAKAYDIKFLDKDEKLKYVWQNTWGFSTRMLGVLFAVHGDDKGLVLPPKVAPNKVVVVPIIFKGKEKEVLEKGKELAKNLKKHDVIFDDREYSAGWKFHEWELKGVPIRLEIGPRDIEKKQVVLVRRDTGEKESVKVAALDKKIDKVLGEMQDALYKKSQDFLEKNMINVKSFDELKKVVKNGQIAVAGWCNNIECEEWIKDKTGGAKILNLEFEKPKSDKCVYCGKPAVYVARIAKSY
ncbi:MAG: proline--tRNA ligase [archaeon]